MKTLSERAKQIIANVKEATGVQIRATEVERVLSFLDENAVEHHESSSLESSDRWADYESPNWESSSICEN